MKIIGKRAAAQFWVAEHAMAIAKEVAIMNERDATTRNPHRTRLYDGKSIDRIAAAQLKRERKAALRASQHSSGGAK